MHKPRLNCSSSMRMALALMALYVSGCGRDQTSTGPNPIVRPATIALVAGDSQVAQVAFAILPLPIRIRVTDLYGNAAVGATVSWATAPGNGSLSNVSTTTDSLGEAQATWAVARQAGTLTASAHVESLPPVFFSASLSPTRLRLPVDSLLFWPGDTATIGVSAFDAAGDSLVISAVTWTSSNQGVVTASTGGVLRAVNEGYANIRAAFGSVSSSASITVGSVLHAQVFPVDSSSPRSLRFFVTAAGRTDSAEVSADGSVILRTHSPFGGAVGDVYFDDAERPNRQFLPSMLRNVSLTSGYETSALLIPTHWTITKGTYAGTVVPISMNAAYAAGNQTIAGSGAREDYYVYSDLRWNGLIAWPDSAFPIPTILDHEGSAVPIAAQDSIRFWSYVDDMESRMGRDLFRPADAKDHPPVWLKRNPDSLLVRPWTVVIHYDGILENPAGGAGVWCFAQCDPVLDFAWGGVEGHFPGFMSQGTTQHELNHVLGMGHTCFWESVMGASTDPETQALCQQFSQGMITPLNDGMTEFDVAYTTIYLRVGEMARRTRATMKLPEAYQGERILVLGLPPTGIP